MALKLDSQKQLKELALFYCSKRETSRVRLGRYLQRKLREQKLEQPDWIKEVLDEFERLKVIDDSRYSEILIREYTRRGKGRRYVEQKLKEKGISGEQLKFETNAEDEFMRACELTEKHHTKLLRKIDDPRLLKQKLLQKLIQTGFSIDVSRRAIEACLKK